MACLLEIRSGAPDVVPAEEEGSGAHGTTSGTPESVPYALLYSNAAVAPAQHLHLVMHKPHMSSPLLPQRAHSQCAQLTQHDVSYGISDEPAASPAY